MAASIDALGPAQANVVYSRAALWNDSRPQLTGTVAQAVTVSQALGATTLYQVLAPLPDGGQAVVTTIGASFANQTRDCLTVLTAPPASAPRDAEVRSLLSADLDSPAKFNALRVLSAAGIPPAQREVFKSLRDRLALPASGQTLAKALKLTDMERYLNGTFDPKSFGFQAVASDIAGLVTPAQLIDGLRLDYPGGFAGQTRLALLYYPQLTSFTLLIPYSAPFGGTQTGDYPFTGNGFTASVQVGAIPEWTLPRSGADLAPGSQLIEVDEGGQRILRGTWNGRVWAGGTVQARALPRERVERPATFRGVPVYVTSRSGDLAFVSVTQAIPEGLLAEQVQVGRDEYRGQVPWAELRF